MTVECRTLAHDDADFAHCAAIRMEVFVVEQKVPPEEELDELDATAVHVLALDEGEPVGTGRLVFEDNRPARIGRMAVRASSRGRGIGSAILLHLMEIARMRGVRTVTLAGQLHAIPFYERHGFTAHGDVFLDAGIEHRWMDRTL
jgi:predicted GNAT family N-acyltransferase